ncbi:MAG: hypothetical protein CMK59_05095 [Proteobacteria bacterium]|nr:hypothetical protein [Pseudomonadota bacterium]
MTTKLEFQESLQKYSTENLSAILQSIDMTKEDLKSDAESSEDNRKMLAEQLTDTLWSKTHTPIGQMLRPNTLEDIASELAKLLEIECEDKENGWAMVDQICNHLLPPDKELQFEDISEEHEQQLKRSVAGFIGGIGTAGSAYLSRIASLKIIQLLSTPLLPLLKLIPTVGPVLITIRTAAGLALRLSGPIGILAAIWSINSALGPDWEKALRILLGVGLLRRTEHATP